MENPSYYAVIPADVRYADITPNAKLLYGEITCLTQQAGFCWASNGYLAKLYNAGERTVSRWLTELEKAGFIIIEPAVNQHGQRKIFIQSALPKVASQKWQAKNGDHNNTSEENTTSSEIPSLSPKPQSKASTLAVPVRSLALILEDLAEIPDNLRLAAECKHNIPRLGIDDEWAKFRNHHISNRSKHTRVDLCWDTWCRNAAKWQRGGKAPAAGASGQGGYKRHDIVASARDRAMVELYGVGAQGHGGQAASPDRQADALGDGDDILDAIFENAGTGHEAVQLKAGGSDGGGADSDAGAAVPLTVE